MLTRYFIPSLSFVLLCATSQTFALSNLSKDNSQVASLVQRIDSLEKQIKILEDNLPKRIRKLPLDLPHITSNGAIQETMTRLYDMLSLNFVDYQLQINSNRQYCNEQSFKQYTAFLKQSKWLDDIASNKKLLYIRPSSTPKITEQGKHDSVYTWQIEIPFNAILENVNESKAYPMVASIEIRRASELVHPLGILITDIKIKDAS